MNEFPYHYDIRWTQRIHNLSRNCFEIFGEREIYVDNIRNDDGCPTDRLRFYFKTEDQLTFFILTFA